MWRTGLSCLMSAYLLCFSGAVWAEPQECDIELEYGLIIQKNRIRVMERSRTVLQISGDSQLFIRGEWIRLDEQDTALLEQYSKGLRREVPAMVDVAMDGVEIGFDAINQTVSGLSGPSPALEQQLENLKFRFRKRFDHRGDIFYIAPQSLAELDDFFEDELALEIKAIVTDSLGAILLTLSEAMKSSETNFEQEKLEFGDKMELLSQEIEERLSEKSLQLEQHAQKFCSHLREINKIENELQQRVPQLRDYDVVKLKSPLKLDVN